MGNTLFVVWRESVEAILVVGILHAWLASNDWGRIGRRYLWGGVAAGMLLALALGAALLFAQSRLPAGALEYFQVGMMLLAAALITQMVFWMRRHGGRLRHELETKAARALKAADGWGIAVLAALAVGREGAETAIFLYGAVFERHGTALLSLLAAALAGLGLALATFWLLSRGGRRLSWRTFFRASGTVLLFLAAALLVGGTERLIGLELLPAGIDPVWDTSALLDNASPAGALLASLTGYRARPALAVLLAYLAYWGTILLLSRRGQRVMAA